MTTLNSKFDLEYRRNRYLNLYDYRASIDIKDIQRMRYYNSYQDFVNYVPSWSVISNRGLTNKDEIIRYFDYMNNVPHDCKLRIEFNRLFIYANDIAHLDYAVDQIAPSGKVKFYKAVAPKDDGTIEFSRQPQYKFRNYFKDRAITVDVKKSLMSFITDQKSFGADIKFNDAMLRWLNNSTYNFVRESYHVDYNDEKLGIILQLMFGEYLKPKVYKLVKRQQ